MSISNKKNLYVIGFPKSGNTWLARLLAEILNSNIDTGYSGDAINSADNSMDRDGGYVVHKRHFTNDVNVIGENSVVYIVRDIRDVLVSGFFFNNRKFKDKAVKRNKVWQWYFNHEIIKLNRRWQGNMLAVLNNKYNDLKILLSGAPPKVIPRTNWSEHVAFWSSQPNVILVRYEDLLDDAFRELKQISGKLGVFVGDEEISNAIAAQKFETRKEKFIENGDKVNANFMRRGKSGGWKDYLMPEVLKKIECEHANVMMVHGYSLEGNK